MLPQQRFAPLDGARGIAVLIVFFSHTSGRGFYIHPALDFSGIGHIGVYLFFCLSAFLLAGKLFEEGIDAASVKRFYIKRFFRIAPLYYLVVVSVFAIQHFTGHYNERFLHISHGFTGFIQHLIYYRGDGVFWSVVVEEQFYLLVPLWIYLFIRFPKASVIGFSILALLNFTLYLCKNTSWPVDTGIIRYLTTNDRSSGNYIDIFITTIIMMFFYYRNKDAWERNKEKIALVANILFVLMLSATVILVSSRFLVFHKVFYNFRYLSIPYAMIFTLFIISVRMGNPLNSLLSFSLLRYFGIFGFSIYLLHMAVFETLGRFIHTPWLGFVSAFAGVLLVGAFFYYLVEKPFIRFSYKLIQKFGLSR